jgi:putative transposase
MTAVSNIDVMEWLRKQVEQAPSGMKEALAAMLKALMDAEVDSICNAGYSERSSDRVNSRNGYRSRHLIPGSVLLILEFQNYVMEAISQAG